MRTIWKFMLHPTQPVMMPKTAGVLSAGAQGEEIVVWANVDSSAPLVPHRFEVVGTGHDASRVVPPGLPFVGTVQMANGLVFHVFDGGEV
jgi:hypothetical protein